MPIMGQKEFKYLNKSINRVDAYDKVTGRARYSGDLEFANMLFGGTLYSPYASAKVTRIDVARARAVPGVKAVITFADLPNQISWGTYPYLTGTIRFQGDAAATTATASPGKRMVPVRSG